MYARLLRILTRLTTSQKCSHRQAGAALAALPLAPRLPTALNQAGAPGLPGRFHVAFSTPPTNASWEEHKHAEHAGRVCQCRTSGRRACRRIGRRTWVLQRMLDVARPRPSSTHASARLLCLQLMRLMHADGSAGVDASPGCRRPARRLPPFGLRQKTPRDLRSETSARSEQQIEGSNSVTKQLFPCTGSRKVEAISTHVQSFVPSLPECPAHWRETVCQIHHTRWQNTRGWREERMKKALCPGATRSRTWLRQRAISVVCRSSCSRSWLLNHHAACLFNVSVNLPRRLRRGAHADPGPSAGAASLAAAR